MIRETLIEEIDRLKQEHREVIILRLFSDLKYREFAEVLNLKIDVVKTRIFRARLILKESLRLKSEILQTVFENNA
ncbi:RNA polymerase sigma factor [Sporosarcina sp. G11-34]|uniref:RNA polymerase sigma factor n=1 Tax=Sporosarcina sp. G11-34 TaxID=2849605 RepID=UPI003FA7AAFE|nr:hypothetical protein [Sporosarcina sp. G11-34]